MDRIFYDPYVYRGRRSLLSCSVTGDPATLCSCFIIGDALKCNGQNLCATWLVLDCYSMRRGVTQYAVVVKSVVHPLLLLKKGSVEI
jgi:hypothetical protein